MTVKAVLHRLLVKPIKLEVYDETRAKLKELGLEYGNTEEAKYHHTQIDQGTVVHIGDTAFLDYVKRHHVDIPVKVGDLVTYARHSGKIVKDGEEEFTLLNDEDVLAVHKGE